ncbi:MAG: hypothetical protein QM773_05780 [Hyphomonadaceae bacterium]
MLSLINLRRGGWFVKRRTWFVLIFGLLIPLLGWWSLWLISMIYFWITERGGPVAAFGIAWGGVIVYLVVAAMSFRDILRILRSND